ncbi:AraC-like DNA-binding protein [Fictibacillus barbaricus]|uniref:AraC-like DNA-binding protein n=1 Tax=Fictibacillus barbaricus TaxID=182136 RepID=A0ABU1U3I8_9BACL|nr:AraC-like DNA-binding protein [Fictibacillus barbaricus]
MESFCLFFKKSFAEEVLRTQNSSPDNLLSDPYKDIPSIGFYEKTYDKNVKLTSLLQTFKQNLDSLKEEPLWLEEQFHKVMQEILIEHQNTIKEVESLHALRASTREEIYKRISTAHDYIRAFYNQVITLDDIAKIACLSPNHLLRNYNKIYGRTPYQHISELRIIKAKELLSESSLNMTGITFELGFSNPVSFSKMFKQHTGISPLQFRKKVILDKK